MPCPSSSSTSIAQAFRYGCDVLIPSIDLKGGQVVQLIQGKRPAIATDDVESWVTFWTRLHANISPEPPAPIVDFDNWVVVAATMGQRATGGYAIRIEEITRVGDDLRVVVLETSPGPTCLTTQAFSAPATAVSVPRPVGNVDFVGEAETSNCS